MLFVCNSSFAQNVLYIDSLLKLNNSEIATAYNKFLNIHNFSNALNSAYSIGNWEFLASNNFNSTFIEAAPKIIRDDNLFLFTTRYKVLEFLKFGGFMKSRIVTDNRKIGLSNVSENTFGILSEIKPVNALIIQPLTGYKLDKQLEQIDKGFIYGADAFLNNFELSQYFFNSNVKYLNENLGPRNNLLLNSRFEVLKEFTKDIRNSFSLDFNEVKRDFYIKLDSSSANFFQTQFNIESRKDNTLSITESLLYNGILEIIDFEFSGNLFLRSVKRSTLYKLLTPPSKNVFDTRVNEFRLNISSSLNFRLGNLNSNFKFIYSERDEKHLVENLPNIPQNFYLDRMEDELKKNNSSVRIQLGSDNSLNIYGKDTLFLNLYLSKLKYDTPSIENFSNKSSIFRDDRDELLTIGRLTYQKYFSHFFYTSVLLEAYMNHLVYIFAERSSNNNWNRVLRLRSNSNYRSKSFSTSNTFEVLANYTIYDFEDLLQTTRSFSFRQFSFMDSTRLALSNKFFTALFFGLKLSEQGSLNWKSFSTKPMRHINELSGELKFGMMLSNFSNINLGFRLFSNREFRYEGNEKVEASNVLSIGPVIDLNIYLKENLTLVGYSWIEFISQTSQPSKRIINFNLRAVFGL